MIHLLWLAGCSSTPSSATTEPLRTVPEATESTTENVDSGPTETGGLPLDTGVVASPLCTFDATQRSCPHTTVDLPVGLGSRQVHLQRPAGTPPADGWPVAILFQGSFFSAAYMWDAQIDDPFGAWHQTGTLGQLLDAGFAVVTPEVLIGGNTYWTTNIPPYSVAWSTSPDHDLMLALFDAFDDGSLADVDGSSLYAAGISSGGYMTSRMAEAYPGRFKALAVHSASWATCGGPLCVVPNTLPSDHPPTLFLHGEQDLVVPVRTMHDYADALANQGIETEVRIDADAGHAWISAAPTEIRDFFLAYP